ncbi:unnamed protein product [Hyaloperonospora brassicae]|uniref:HSF-type DNA-binding domain-containing protein n=1 Tax=Hyaloperonospora brassicae TaxID=162125 RepID=A0AAV0SVD6_HYABA|nr:unnamed protein product [Hyaloperonospora brassicae]
MQYLARPPPPPFNNSSTDTAPPREVAPFLKSLRRMLQDESAAVLRWTADGRAFEIHDMHAMMAHVLPKYFKHCKYTSFQRQLNYFSFRKWTKSKAIVCTFSNDFFLRDRPELAWRITRKKSLSPPSLNKYRSTAARASIAPYWKKESGAVLPPTTSYPVSDSPYLMLADDARGGRLPFGSSSALDSDLMLLKPHESGRFAQLSRRFSGFNATAAAAAYPASRSYDATAADGAAQGEPLDWIDCLLPPLTDDAYYMGTYPTAAVTPYAPPMTNGCKSFEFMPSSL